MTVIGYRRITILALLCVAVLLALVWHLAMECAVQQADARGAWSAIAGYGRSRNMALRSEPEDAAQMLHIIAILPARQTNSSDPLIRMVERERDRDVRDVIEYLRAKTGEDFGDDPAKWIEKYSGHEARTNELGNTGADTTLTKIRP